jgi:thymidylate kinase
MKITIIEGARGTGKSTIASKLRQKTADTTLINFTGFSEDGQSGLLKVTDYYCNWMIFFNRMRNHKSNFVFDRFYFSESVYSLLYKDYSFTDVYRSLNDMLIDLSDEVVIDIFFLTVNDEEVLKQRLLRDKVPFGKADENVQQSILQQTTYRHLFHNLDGNENLKIHTIDTSHISIDEVYDKIVGKLEDRS